MTHPRWLLLSLPLFALGCAVDGAPRLAEQSAVGSDVICDQHGCISQSKLSANLKSKLDSQVVGYAARVGTLPAIVGGHARTATDSPPSGVAMSTALRSDVASISKLVTTVAVLHALDQYGVSIDAPITSYLWPTWAVGPNIAHITFRDLLTHRSGFRDPSAPYKCNGAGVPYADLQTKVAAGVNATDQTVAYYNNCNFAIFRELLPFIAGQGQHYSGAATDAARAAFSAAFYVDYVNEYVFAPLGLGSRQCSGSPSSDILSYPNPANNVAGTDWSGSSLNCGASNWYLSLDDLATFTADLASGNRMLTAAQKQEMNRLQLGWDNSVNANCPLDDALCKNGGLPANDGAWIVAYTGIMKCNLPVVALVNSPLPASYQNGSGIIGLVTDSFSAAGVSGTPVCCDGSSPCGGGANGLDGACCEPGQQCVAGRCTGCINSGSGCDADGDCCSRQCSDGACVCALVGESCAANSGCCSGQCAAGQCACLPIGHSCTPGSSAVCCGTAVCNSAGICNTPSSPPGTLCDGVKQPPTRCTLVGGWRCCGTDGWSCGVCS